MKFLKNPNNFFTQLAMLFGYKIKQTPIKYNKVFITCDEIECSPITVISLGADSITCKEFIKCTPLGMGINMKKISTE